MYKKLILLFFISFSLFSCKKESETDYLAVDIEKITTYLNDNNLVAQKLESGLFYIIINEGGTDKPTATSTVTVSYKGSFFDGDVFDQGSFFTSPLNQLIEGWIQGIPLIGAAGKIKLFIPSTLAYGSGGAGSIPPNTPLIFEVTLHYFSN